MLLEGMSIRACQRLTGMKIGTICDLIVHVGDNCGRLLETTVKGVAASFVEMDELWSFVGMKAKTAERKNLGPEVGDSWTWLAIDADTKMILAHAVGQRDESTCERFLGSAEQRHHRPDANHFGRPGALHLQCPFCSGFAG